MTTLKININGHYSSEQLFTSVDDLKQAVYTMAEQLGQPLWPTMISKGVYECNVIEHVNAAWNTL